MNKEKTDLQEIETPSTEELFTDTKNTLRSYIKVNTFLGFAAGLAAGVTMLGIPMVEDTQKKVILGCSGALVTTAALGTIAFSMNKMNDFIDNHDDVTKLQVIGQFLNAKGEEAKNDLIDSMVDELHTKVNQ